MSTTPLVYDPNYNELQDAEVFDFRERTLVFSEGTALSVKCYAVYEKFKSQYAVYDFLNEFYADEIKWAYCEPCEIESPYESSRLRVLLVAPQLFTSECLVCGSSMVVSDDEEDN